MSSATAITYTVEELAAMREAADLARERSRLRVAEQSLDALAAECSAFESVYGERVVLGGLAPVAATAPSRTVGAAADAAEREAVRGRARLDEARRHQQRARLRERLRLTAPPAEPGARPAEPAERAATAAPAVRDEAPAEPRGEVPSRGAAPADAGQVAPSRAAHAPSRAVPVAAREARVAPRETVAPTDTLGERVDACLRALDDGVVLSESFVTLARSLTSAPADDPAGTMAYRALQDEVAQLNRAHRVRRQILAALDELDVRLGAVPVGGPGPDGARAALEVARARVVGGASVDLAPVRAGVLRAEADARQAADRVYVEDTLTAILGDLGYEVVPGFEKVVPRGGRLVRKPGWAHHGVRVDVAGDEITLDVVRTVPEDTTSPASVRDEETEAAFCADVPELVENLARAGVVPQKVNRIPPGVIAVPRVEVPVEVPAGRAAAARRQAPRGREQRR